MCIPGGGHGESQNEGCGLERNGENTSEKFPEIGKNFPDVTLRVSNGDPSHMAHTNIYISPLQILCSGLMIVFGLGGGDPTDAPHPGRGEPRASTCTDGC